MLDGSQNYLQMADATLGVHATSVLMNCFDSRFAFSERKIFLKLSFTNYFSAIYLVINDMDGNSSTRTPTVTQLERLGIDKQICLLMLNSPILSRRYDVDFE